MITAIGSLSLLTNVTRTKTEYFFNTIRDFLGVPQGPFMGPCSNAKYPNLSQFNKKNPNQKINLSSFQQLVSFLSLGCSFFQFKVK